MCKMSVIVITYNQSPQSIFQTLNSIVCQNFDDFEVIISDDGSKVTHSEAIGEYLDNSDFRNYRIITRDNNVGTVKNILEAMLSASGEFVKCIGAGDLLYSPNTLNEIYDFCKQNRVTLGFGLIKAYSLNNGELSIQPFHAPRNTEVYRKESNSSEKLEQLLINDDWLPGSGLFYQKDSLIDLFTILSNDFKVKYCEDLVVPLVLFEGNIDYLDKYILWYEWGVGISNDGSSAARERMYKDHSNYFVHLAYQYPKNSIVKRAKNRFVLKRFVMLHTPLGNILNRFRSTQYLDESKSEYIGNSAEEQFLLSSLCLD